MTRLHRRCAPLSSLTKCSLLWLAFALSAHGQVPYQDTDIEIHDLPTLVARTHHSSDVLLTSLDTVFHNKDVCCGSDSALGDSAQAADPKSLKDVAAKLDGRHLFPDGRPIKVTAQYVTAAQINSGDLISAILNQHAALLEWNSHIYVVRGLVYIWATYGSADNPVAGTIIRKILLWDTRYSDARREVLFTRNSDDLSSVQGLLFLTYAPQ